MKERKALRGGERLLQVGEVCGEGNLAFIGVSWPPPLFLRRLSLGAANKRSPPFRLPIALRGFQERWLGLAAGLGPGAAEGGGDVGGGVDRLAFALCTSAALPSMHQLHQPRSSPQMQMHIPSQPEPPPLPSSPPPRPAPLSSVCCCPFVGWKNRHASEEYSGSQPHHLHLHLSSRKITLKQILLE